MEVDGGKGRKIQIVYFPPYPISLRSSCRSMKFSFGTVQPTSGQASSKIDVYKMERSPHGTALIINNEQFLEHDKREGTAIDERNLTHLFRYLDYKVEVHRNLDSGEMWSVMEEMGQRNHGEYDSFVCCILSHGSEGHVFGTDSVMVSLNDLTGMVDAQRCPSLVGKPKLFFLQACRGKMKEVSHRVGTDSDMPRQRPMVATDVGVRVGTDGDTHIPTTADFFFGYATPHGHVAWRDFDHGSWYVSELCRSLCEYSTHVSLSDMMTQVSSRVGREHEHLSFRMAPETQSRLQKNVYF